MATVRLSCSEAYRGVWGEKDDMSEVNSLLQVRIQNGWRHAHDT